MVTQTVPASPSLSRTGSARRPNSLALGSTKSPSTSNSPKSPSSTSLPKSTKSPGSPAPSIKGRSAPRRTGSLGKGSQITKPVGPNLSTEARSLTRPCGCGKPGHGGGRGTGHKDGHASNGHHAHDDAQHSQHASPAPERKERAPKKSVKSPTKAKSPPAQIMPPPPPAQTEEPEIIKEIIAKNMIENESNTNLNNNDEDSSKSESTQVSYQDLKNRYISTLVWVPRMMPQMMTEKCF